MNPYLQDADVTIYQGDSLEVLRQLPDESVHMCCTSPPFYGLRDYGMDGQIGLEPTPDEWVARLVEVFREVRRVLRSDGTLWLEVGDSYAGGKQGRADGHLMGSGGFGGGPIASKYDGQHTSQRPVPAGLKSKDLIGAPWLLAFALRADGWYLRSEIIWAKPNPMPESVTDRPTVSHSRVFLLTKAKSYFYDAEAIREPMHPASEARYAYAFGGPKSVALSEADANGMGVRTRPIGDREPTNGRNKRTVWTVATEPYAEAHFATWPTKLVEPMILAGTSERGVCPECGAPWERIVETNNPSKWAADDDVRGWSNTHSKTSNAQSSKSLHRQPGGVYSTAVTRGWKSGCGCGDSAAGERHPEPATVLDPFGGSGTTAAVARKHGRHAILIELNPDYCELAARRLSQQSLFALSTDKEKESSEQHSHSQESPSS